MENKVKREDCHYVYLGSQKKSYLSYAHCPNCGGYLGGIEVKKCPQCNTGLDWSNINYLI